MNSREQDLLGTLIDTSLQPYDDAPSMDNDGGTALLVPEGQNDEETEADDVFEELRDELSPGEASELVETMKPLDEEEREILKNNPELRDLTRVDDAEHEDWMVQNSRAGYKAMDEILDDAVFGDTDIGLSFKSIRRGISKGLRQAGRGVSKGARRTRRMASKGIRKAGGAAYKYSGAKFAVKKAQQAALWPIKKVIRKFTGKIVGRRASYLAKQQGLAKPTPAMNAQAKSWAKQFVRQKDPKFGSTIASLMGNDEVLNGMFDDSIGVDGKTVALVALGPVGLAILLGKYLMSSKQEAPPMDNEDPNADPAAELAPTEEEMNPEYQETPPDEAPPEYAQEEAPYDEAQGDELMITGIDGEDSLGAFATEILSGAPAPATDDSGAWAHMLNPLYWLKSKDERRFTDVEKAKWIENAALQKQLGKRQKVLDQAEKAKQAAEAVAQAKAQAAATEAQLKAIESSLSGELIRDLNADVNGSFVGHEKPTAVTKVVFSALDKVGKRKIAADLYAKIAQGQPLSKEELKEARGIARLLNKVKVVHGDLITADNDPALVMHGAFVGACVMGGIKSALDRNAKLALAASHMSKKLASGKPMSAFDRKITGNLLLQTQKLRNFTKAHITGAAFVGHDKAVELRQAAVLGAAKVMSAEDKKMVATILNLAKQGNPNAIKAFAALKKSGEIMGGDFVGSVLSKAFKYATMPITAPAKALWKGTKWTARKIGLTKGRANPAQVRLAKLAAARKRAEAARARARAADAETEAELRAQQAIAAAADAEADAADAAALAKEAAMRTQEIEANPDMAETEDSSGEFIGTWTEILGKDTRAKKIVAKASEKSAAGTKIRAGARMYKRMLAGDPKAKEAYRVLCAKYQKNDPQAKRDLNAIWAGRAAVRSKAFAQKKLAKAQIKKARHLRTVAVQRKFEAKLANKLARIERRSQLRKLATVEAKAARGNKKAASYIAKQVAAAKKGDRKAAARVEGMKLARNLRKVAPTKRERRNLAQAARILTRARKGDPRAVRTIAVTRDAARAGNPNAKRAMRRYDMAAITVTAIATGVIASKKSKKAKAKIAKNKTQIAQLNTAKRKAAAGNATREELVAGARAANQLGLKEEAGQLAVLASKAPSATETLKTTATVVAAKEAGNPQAKAAVSKIFEEAKQGDPAAIKKMGNVLAVQTIDDINKGKPVTQTMVDAVNLQQRAAAGDPAATAVLKEVAAASTKDNPSPEATAAAIASTAAVMTVAALASKPKARAAFQAKINPPLADAEKGPAQAEVATMVAKAQDGTISAEEGVRAARLAERLGNTGLAAKIRSMAPPMDYSNAMALLPDLPLPPIASFGGLVKESLKALTLSTRDPFGNYRGGVSARSTVSMAGEPVTTSGWSPFNFFKSFARNANIILPATGMLSSAASLAMAISNRKGQKVAKVAAPSPAPSPAPTPAPSPVAAPNMAPATAPTIQSGDELFKDTKDRVRKQFDPSDILPPEDALTPKQILEHALNNKKMSKEDFKKLTSGKSKKAERLLTFLKSKGVTIGSDEILGAETKSFKAIITDAIKAKKISKDDFNQAIATQVGPKGSRELKLASADKILRFLKGKGVAVG